MMIFASYLSELNFSSIFNRMSPFFFFLVSDELEQGLDWGFL
jgi:hypothetical protein